MASYVLLNSSFGAISDDEQTVTETLDEAMRSTSVSNNQTTNKRFKESESGVSIASSGFGVKNSDDEEDEVEVEDLHQLFVENQLQSEESH